MKYVVLLGDGMADRPLDVLDGRTPLQAARTPNMDRIAAGGVPGLIRTVPDGFPAGSDVANLSVLGYDPSVYYTGRAPLEAASMSVTLEPADVAFRCNLVTLEDGRMADFSAGHITTDEAKALITDVHKELADGQVAFYPGVSYRHLMVWQKGKRDMICTPPHDITGQPFKGYLPAREGHELLNDLMLRAQGLLRDHPVNRKRADEGKRPANAIWLWGQGIRPSLPTFEERYGLTGAVISAVDLLKGIGIYAGLTPIEVPGATAYFDTNYRGKALAALKALQEMDFVYVHVEAPDEAGHMGDVEEKVRAIENFDEKVVGPIWEGLQSLREFRILLLPDHPTPIETRTHSKAMSPFVIFDSREVQASQDRYDEETARRSGRVVDPGFAMMDQFIGNRRSGR
jgi:2,3-bisphosphoglycerate-independent phosphoglycerate mutase